MEKRRKNLANFREKKKWSVIYVEKWRSKEARACENGEKSKEGTVWIEEKLKYHNHENNWRQNDVVFAQTMKKIATM